MKISQYNLRSGVVGFFIGAAAAAFVIFAVLKPSGGVAVPDADRSVVAAVSPAAGSTALRPVVETSQQEAESGLSTEFGLSLDDPGFRKRLQARDKKLIGMLMEPIRTEYDVLCAELGVSPSAKEALLRKVELVYRAKIESRKYMTQLADAQHDCDGLAKALFGEKYQDYRSYEDARKAREESGQMAEFLKKSGKPNVSAEKWLALQDAIQTNGAYSARTLSSIFGPFDEVAAPLVGARVAIPAFEKEAAALARNGAAVVEAARKMSFSAEEMAALESYYSAQNAFFQNEIAIAKDPRGAYLKAQEAKLSVLKEDPNATPEEIARVERRLRALGGSQGGRK